MALSVLTDTKAINPVRNPVWYELQCGGFRTTAPVAASYTLDVVDDPTDGLTFSIAVGSTIVQFTWVTGAPDTSGLQVRIGSDTVDSRNNLYNALRGNWQVNQWFAITQTTVISLVVRTPGLLGAVFTNTSPVTMAWVEVNPGVDGVYASNYGAVVQVWMELVWDSGIYVPKPPLLLSPDPDRRTRTDLRGMLAPSRAAGSAGWAVGYNWPNYGANKPFRALDVQRRFYVERYEQLGDPPTPQLVTRSTVRKAWYAGSRNIERNIIQEVFTLMINDDAENPALTYRGRAGRHEVSQHQQHYLSYYRRTAVVVDVPMELRLTVTYSDGTNYPETFFDLDAAIEWKQGEVATWPVGFRTMGLHELQPTKTPVKYTAVLRTADEDPSEAHVFWLVDTDANEQHLEFINSFGVVESIRCEGQWVLGIESDHTEVVRLMAVVLSNLPSVQESSHLHLLNGAQQKITLSTGFMDRGELNALVDVLLSPEWRLCDTARGLRRPLRLVGAEHVMRSQGDPQQENLYALNLEFLEGAPEMAWSDRISMPALPEGAEEEETGGDDGFDDEEGGDT
ncbi:MAG TPA: hypothetical protein PLB89_04665 [Flavobacteriales bacterium]|nr:hypothetical protein [Flavobacteriales bacterium]